MRTIIIVLITFLLNSTAYSCSCGGPYTFCETIELQTAKEEYIVKAVKLRDVNHGMDVEVINAYKGQIPGETIRVWGDNGFLCRVYTNQFIIGDTIIMNLYLVDEIYPGLNDIGGEKVGDYELSICGLHFLQVKNNNVTGNIISETQQIEIGQFDESMMNGKLFDECVQTNVEESKIFQDILLYPNPAAEEVRIISNRRISSIIIYNSLGQNIYEQINLNNIELDIDVSEFERGLYFVEVVDSSGKSITKKIYKN